MKLKLLLGLLFVVWRSTTGEEYTNHYRATEDIANVEFCSHDSFNNGSCVCDVDYNGNFCLNRKCRNFGYNGQNFPTGFKVDRCICPPGFLGRNCEPVSCVPGKDQLYTSLPNEKSISLLVTYNTKMAETWKTGNIGDLVCNKETYWRSFNYNYENINYNMRNENASECIKRVNNILDPDPCLDDDGKPIPCQKLNVVNLNTLVQNSPPNSIIFVVTNMGLVSNTAALQESIIATSIARRIQINVLVYNNTGFMSDDPGLAYLSDIASATFGTYVLPSVKPVNEQYDIVKILLDNWDQGNLVSAVFTDETKNLPMDNAVDYYVAAQTYYGENLAFNLDPQPIVVNSTDFWKLYKITSGSVEHILTITGQLPNTPVLLYSSGGLKAYSAFTSDEPGNVDVVDAAYSISVNGTQYSLVVRLESGNSVLDFDEKLRSIGAPKTISLGTSFYNRSVCQFNYQVDANCKDVGASIVTLVTGDNLRSVSFPVYCASFNYASSIYDNFDNEVVDFVHLQQKQSMSRDFACTTDIGIEEYGGRSFVIIAENSKDSTNPEKSSVDNVFRNKNSIFYQLSDFVNGDGYNKRYVNFLAKLHYGTDSNSLTQSPDYQTFLTKIMSATSSPTEHKENEDAISVKDIIVNTIKNTNTYSDIFIVVNYNLTVSDSDVETIQQELEVQRSRLYVLFVQTYMNYTNVGDYYAMNKLSIGSGGVAVRLKDYNELHTFFAQYFPILVANDIVAKAYSENQKAGIALNDVYLLAESYYLLVTNEDALGDGISQATINVDGITVTNILNIGELQLFELTAKNATKYNIPIFFTTGGLARHSSAILFVNTANQDFISLSFVDKDGKNRNDIVYNEGAYTPVIYSSSPFDSSSNIFITYSDEANPAKLIYNGSITNITDCDGFKNYNWTTKYSWPCSESSGLYHIKIDRSSNNQVISRTFPITCIGASIGGCLNGGSPIDEVTCKCPIEWTGTHCESPVCLNGGTVTSAHTCSCLPSFTGTFCETSYAICGSSPKTPDYRADLSSLVIVADVNALAFGGMTADFGVTGVPITVILYGDGNAPRIVQSTTNSQHLLDVLKQVAQTTPATSPSPAPVNSDMYKAMNLALDNQLTNRALLVVYTSNADITVDSDFLIRLAIKRAEVRVLSISGAESNNARTLSLVGNGIPIAVTNTGHFQTYLSSYVAQLFQSLQYQANVPQRVFNVFKTDQLTGPTTVEIPKDTFFDTAPAIIFVHVYKGYLDGTPSFTPIGIIGDTNIYSVPYDQKDGKTLSLKWSITDVTGFYSVEVVGYLKTAYLFNINNANGAIETLNSGLVYNQANSMHIFSSPLYDAAVSNPANFPSISMKEILSNGTLSDPKTVLFSKKINPTCFFKYFTTLDVCSNNATIGYQVQLTTFASATQTRQQQFVLTCFRGEYQSGNTDCKGHGSPGAICSCDRNWGGIDCTEPICVNGVRDMSVCRCPVNNYGLLCDKTFGAAPLTTSTAAPTTTTPKAVRVVAFILDLIGTDDYAYNQTIQSLTQYYKAFGNSHWVLLVHNLNQTYDVAPEFQQYQGDQYLLNATVDFWPLRSKASRTSSVTLALTTIKNAYNKKEESFNSAASLNIFYLTQIGISSSDVPSNNMDGLQSFTKSAVAYSPFTTSVDPTVTDSLKQNFSTNVSTAREYYNGLLSMVTSTSQNTNAKLPDKPETFRCVYGLQSNIRVAIDRSNFSSNAVNESLNDFLTNFRLGFNFIENDEDRCSTKTLPAFYKERTALTAFPYYDNVVKTAKFCPSQYTSMLSFAVNGKQTVPNYENPKYVSTLGKNINSADCSCNRFFDDNTIKFILWLPRAPIPSSDDFLQSLKLNTTNAYHFVVPFYDITNKATDLYYQILVNQVKGGDYYLLPNAAKATNIQTDVIDVLYEKLCESAGVDPTAVPPPPTFLESYSLTRQEDYDYGIFYD
ncbi:unnamed protein product [Caenorhabditis brenneri]